MFYAGQFERVTKQAEGYDVLFMDEIILYNTGKASGGKESYTLFKKETKAFGNHTDRKPSKQGTTGYGRLCYRNEKDKTSF